MILYKGNGAIDNFATEGIVILGHSYFGANMAPSEEYMEKIKNFWNGFTERVSALCRAALAKLKSLWDGFAEKNPKRADFSSLSATLLPFSNISF